MGSTKYLNWKGKEGSVDCCMVSQSLGALGDGVDAGLGRMEGKVWIYVGVTTAWRFRRYDAGCGRMHVSFFLW